jgi:hypothetical protein
LEEAAHPFHCKQSIYSTSYKRFAGKKEEGTGASTILLPQLLDEYGWKANCDSSVNIRLTVRPCS